MKTKCTKELAVKMAEMGIFRGIFSCPVCGHGHSPYDVIKQPWKYEPLNSNPSKTSQSSRT